MITVIADDLSGAAELAGLALRHGLRAEVQTAFSAATDADVVCVDTDTRLLPEAEAARIAEAVARAALAARPAWIFKKCDSVLRGPVLAEAHAIARATGAARIVVVPANPSRDRIIRRGEYFVGGVPLDLTDFARDPAHPRTTARVAELLGKSDPVETQTTSAQPARPPEGHSKPAPPLEIPDAETSADIARIAASADAAALSVGAADFFSALLAARVPPNPILGSALPSPHFPTLLVCGSAASWPQRRAAADSSGLPVFALPHDPVAIARALRSAGRALVGIGDGPTTRGVAPAALTAALTATVAAVIPKAVPARLLLEGGATARAVITALGWTRLRACEISMPGIGALRPVDAPGPLLLIKPGSYPWPADVWLG
jgi:uncharacterized protein YgbK (DUF1537 family)